jgi:hypothetical protein
VIGAQWAVNNAESRRWTADGDYEKKQLVDPLVFVRHSSEIPECPKQKEQGQSYWDEPQQAKNKVEHGSAPVPAFRSATPTLTGRQARKALY